MGPDGVGVRLVGRLAAVAAAVCLALAGCGGDEHSEAEEDIAQHVVPGPLLGQAAEPELTYSGDDGAGELLKAFGRLIYGADDAAHARRLRRTGFVAAAVTPFGSFGPSGFTARAKLGSFSYALRLADAAVARREADRLSRDFFLPCPGEPCFTSSDAEIIRPPELDGGVVGHVQRRVVEAPPPQPVEEQWGAAWSNGPYAYFVFTADRRGAEHTQEFVDAVEKEAKRVKALG
jgi:hypothetical protein